MKRGGGQSVAVEASWEARDRQAGVVNGRQGDEQAGRQAGNDPVAQGDKVRDEPKDTHSRYNLNTQFKEPETGKRTTAAERTTQMAMRVKNQG